MRETYVLGPTDRMADPDEIIVYAAQVAKPAKNYSIIPLSALSATDPELSKMLHIGTHGLKKVILERGLDIGYWWQLTIFNDALPKDSINFLQDKGIEVVHLETYDEKTRTEPKS